MLRELELEQEAIQKDEKKDNINVVEYDVSKKIKQVQKPLMFYHLKHDNKRLFKAVIAEKDNIGREKLKKDENLFIIRGVYINKAIKWKKYKPDQHVINSTIPWKIKDSVKLKDKMTVDVSSIARDVSGVNEVEMGRKRNRQLSKQEIRKRKRNSGEKYETSHQNEDVPEKRMRLERSMKPPCSCKQKCIEKVSEEDRQDLFATFWNFGDLGRQQQFVVNNITLSAVKRRRIREPENTALKRKERKATYVYHFRGVQVCKKMFLNTLDIADYFVSSSFSKVSEGNVVLPDNRGKHKSNILDPQVRDSIIEHIKSFPIMESHYVRADTQKQYFESNLNLSKLYELYVEKMAGTSLKVASKSSYTNIFNHSFNIGFHKPKKDRCSKCIEFEMANGDEKTKMLPEYELHMDNKAESRKLKTQLKEEAKTSNQRVIAFDLEKVLTCPKGENSLFFYKRKMHCYNLTITDLVTGEAYCYVWDQTQGQRGANEIASCLYAYLNVHCKEELSTISLFADNCPGQNKNRFVIQMLSLALLKNSNLKVIQLIFLEVGHTQNENDTIHSLIEGEKKGIDIYHPAQWNTVIATASKKKKLHVEPMSWEDFKSFNTPLDSTYSYLIESRPREKNNINKQVSIKWDEIMHVRFEQENPMVMQYKHHLQEEHFQEGVIGFLPRITSRSKEINFQPPCHYKGMIPISKELYNDLQFLCDKNAIPKQYHAFYTGLKHK